MDPIDEAPRLILDVSYDVKSNLFLARLDNGARFNFSPVNVSGKLGQNLDLLRDYTIRNSKNEAPSPHVCTVKRDPDSDLIDQAIKSGKLQKVGIIIKDDDLIDF